MGEDNRSVTPGDARVRLRFFTRDPTIRVSEAPLAVPVSLNRRGLSEVIDHLRGKAAESEITRNKKTLGGYDFVIENQLLRCPLEKFLRATGISTELSVDVEYFRTLQAPVQGSSSKSEAAWVGSLVACEGNGGEDMVLAGAFDGSLRCHSARGCVELGGRWLHAHRGPIKAMAVLEPEAQEQESGGSERGVVTAGKDQVVKVWQVVVGGRGERKGGKEAAVRPVSTLIGHENSVECVAVRGKEQVLSGDWGGVLCVWKIDKEDRTPVNVPSSTSVHKRKKRKVVEGLDDEDVSPPIPGIHAPVSLFKAHAQCVSGVKWHPKESLAFTSSWDHSVKIWDLEHQNCLQTLNGSKVVTSFAISSGNLLGAGHPDGRLRIWDVRSVEEKQGMTLAAPGKRVLASCGSWISGVAWHPQRDNVLAAISHDGYLRVWDLRATKPLHTLRAHEDKALALCFGRARDQLGMWGMFTGGADGVVRRFETS